MPRISIVSRSVSPGGDTLPGLYSFVLGLVMGILHADNFYGGHLRPTHSTIGHARNGIVYWHKQQAILASEIERHLAGAVAAKLVAPPRQVTHVLKGPGRPEIVQSSRDYFRHVRAVPAFQPSLVITIVSETIGSKRDVHPADTPINKRLTHYVKKSKPITRMK
jgi:hypothetical protein